MVEKRVVSGEEITLSEIFVQVENEEALYTLNFV